MKYELINQPDEKYNAKQQLLINRGIKEEDLVHYMNLTDDDINDPKCFGEQLLEDAAAMIRISIDREDDVCVIVDCDCDGYTSSAILINYLHDLAPAWAETHISWYMHEGKQHGLSDAMEWIYDMGPSLVIIPDAGSNDTEQIKELYDKAIDVIILDHHIIEGEPSPYCFLINSQLPQYPNKELSGAGVVWQFCRYMDRLWGNDFADKYLDLAALGNDGDMMSLRSLETRRLIFKGLEPENIRNPFIYYMWQKNKFKLGDAPTAWGFTFYIVPFVNAITRSGTLDEKELIFNSMLEFKAFQEILSNKRGHKVGEKEKLVEQAIRTCTNVKNRQGRAEEAGLDLVEHLIKDNNMMEHKVLLFLLEPEQIKPEIRGLIANKLMARYQRPCCMLTKTIDKETGRISYQGSARGCDKVGVTEFKNICAETGACDYTIGHQGAFGLGITVHSPDDEFGEMDGDSLIRFIESTDEQLKDMSSEPMYYVDYIWTPDTADAQAILDIAEFDPYIGKDMDSPIVAIKNLKITKNNLFMMANNTIKIVLPNGISLIKFKISDNDYNNLYSEFGFVEIDIVGECNINEWKGVKYPQILIKDYEIIDKCAYVF